MSVYSKGLQRSQVTIGAALYHTVGDRERALEQLNTGFKTLTTEVMKLSGWSADPYQEGSGPLWDWWKLVGVPVLNEWQAFYAKQWASAWTRWATNWESYEGWQERLKKLRDAVVSQGASLTSPDPSDLPTTIIQDVGNQVKRAGEGLGGVVKVAAYTAVGIGAVYVAKTLFKSDKREG